MTTYHCMHRKTTCHHGNDGYIYVLHFGSQLPRKDLVLCSHSNHGVVVAQNYSTCHEHYHGTSPALENSGHNVCFNLFAMVNEWRLLHSCAVADVRLGLVPSGTLGIKILTSSDTAGPIMPLSCVQASCYFFANQYCIAKWSCGRMPKFSAKSSWAADGPAAAVTLWHKWFEL
jgi:hypothetical protein